MDKPPAPQYCHWPPTFFSPKSLNDAMLANLLTSNLTGNATVEPLACEKVGLFCDRENVPRYCNMSGVNVVTPALVYTSCWNLISSERLVKPWSVLYVWGSPTVPILIGFTVPKSRVALR